MNRSTDNLVDAAQHYLDAGLCVLPAHRSQKRPAVGRWKRYQTDRPTMEDLSAGFATGADGVCILCGTVSQNVEIIDFDGGGEMLSHWWDRIEPDLRDRLVVERTPSGGSHVIYRCEVPVCGNMKLAQRKVDQKVTTLIETRGEGGLFLCAPTEGYRITQGDLCDLPVLSEAERDHLLQAAWELNEHWPEVVDGPPVSADNLHNVHMSAGCSHIGPLSADNSNHGHMSTDSSHNGSLSADHSHHGPLSAHNSHPVGHPSHMADRPGDLFNQRGDVRAVLEQHGWICVRGGDNQYWRRPGKTSGWSATLKDRVFYVFSSNAAPFEPNRGYSPFAVYTLLTCGGDYPQAARSLRSLGYGADGPTEMATGADISAMVDPVGEPSAVVADHPAEMDDPADPGPIPEHLFDIPGLVRQVMDFTLANAPYPNVGLAFCGALALQSYLSGRKICDSGDLRTNIYLLALASSGTGKDFPRKVNGRIMFEIGQVQALGDKFASGEGIQDAMARSGAMLFQNDEMDGVLRQINLDRESRHESIPTVLLTFYTSSGDVYVLRVKAGQKEAGFIDQPHLVLFGTATPQYFYESLSQRMLTNGFFARLIIVDIGSRGPGQTPGSPRQVPERILETARWWAEFQPGTVRKNLLEVHPEPRVVPATPEAEEAITHLQQLAEAEYASADGRNDEVARVAWSRTCENAKKLALIRAASENHEDPCITLASVEWATTFAMHQTRRQLYLAQSYVAENPFHGECLKVIRKLKAEPDRQLPHQVLLKRMKTKAKDLREIIETLEQSGDVLSVPVKTGGRTGLVYRLVGTTQGVK